MQRAARDEALLIATDVPAAARSTAADREGLVSALSEEGIGDSEMLLAT